MKLRFRRRLNLIIAKMSGEMDLIRQLAVNIWHLGANRPLFVVFYLKNSNFKQT